MLKIFNTPRDLICTKRQKGTRMSFHEKSAWVMLIALSITTALYISSLLGLSSVAGHLIEPSLPMLIAYTIVLVVISVVGQIVIAILAPKDANSALDERDQGILVKASHWSSFILGFGVVSGLLHYLVFANGGMLFYIVFGSLVFSQIVEYMAQIFLYRRGF